MDNLYKKKMISKVKYDEYKRDLDVIIAQPIERRESRTSGERFMSDRLNLIEKKIILR